MTLNVQQSIFAELADFLVTQPALEERATYKVSSGVQLLAVQSLQRTKYRCC